MSGVVDEDERVMSAEVDVKWWNNRPTEAYPTAEEAQQLLEETEAKFLAAREAQLAKLPEPIAAAMRADGDHYAAMFGGYHTHLTGPASHSLLVARMKENERRSVGRTEEELAEEEENRIADAKRVAEDRRRDLAQYYARIDQARSVAEAHHSDLAQHQQHHL